MNSERQLSIKNDVIFDESESISGLSDDNKSSKRSKVDREISKIIISPLERYDTIQTVDLMKGDESTPKIVDPPPVSRNTHFSKQNHNFMTVGGSRATTTRLIKRPISVFDDEDGMLYLSGEKINQLNTIERYRRHLATRGTEMKALVSDAPSRKTSIDDASEMPAIYNVSVSKQGKNLGNKTKGFIKPLVEQKPSKFYKTDKSKSSRVLSVNSKESQTDGRLISESDMLTNFSPQTKKSLNNLEFTSLYASGQNKLKNMKPSSR